ncbi:HTH-type transcriptional regulator ZntR [Devosia equisanguinis]|uniref:HTH-type transcriptional regulator ZntR n=1 Tax=Devosia equisanguinis TaxID=2490941 RepID=A0A3S5D3B8_9HYPH|nr:helix-turn-helix domain-containing protein [Devosia equisanguinis]VDS04261.1 HTH-type transcriptional regulator ZntR [Devosia equisanguinis]
MSIGVAIGKVSQASGVKVPTIRYYEQIGLLPVPPRTDGGRRSYDRKDMERLTFIRHSRELGFEIDEIKTLLKLQDQPEQSCERADGIAREHLVAVKAKIASLQALQHELERMVEGCSHGRVESCRVIEILADHGQCQYHGEAA